MSGNWIAIGTIDDIPLRGARCVKTPQGKIGVFRTAENEVFAIEDHCPHKGGPLTQGIVHGKAVTCPLHNWVISLETGRALGADEIAALETWLAAGAPMPTAIIACTKPRRDSLPAFTFPMRPRSSRSFISKLPRSMPIPMPPSLCCKMRAILNRYRL